MEIQKLIDKIESNEIILPEFQREYVWKKSQAKELMKSLYKEYPIGSILIWETENPPEIKNDAVNIKDYGLFKVLLDGQQRLTVLYLMLKNQIPPYYKENEILHDPRSLYLNLETDELKYENKTIKTNPHWVKIVDVFSDTVGVFELAKEVSNDNDYGKKAEHLNRKLNRLKSIKKQPIKLEELPKSADIHQAIDLFDKVNSQGTELGDSELALAHMSAQWPYIRREIKKVRNRLTKKGFSFKLDFYVKCIIATVTDTMTYEKVYQTSKNKLIDVWEKLTDTFEYAFNFLENEAHIIDSSYLSTRAVLIPFIYFLFNNNIKLNASQKGYFKKWLYAALMWSRYGSSTDSKLNKDLSLLEYTQNPTKNLMEEIKDDRGRVEVEASDLEGRGKRSHRFYNMMRVVIRNNQPVDWQTGEPLVGEYRLESHHIFPKSRLYDKIYSSHNHMGKKRVNEIANRVFLTSRGNKIISNRLPEDYLPEVNRNHPEALKNQFLPLNENLWQLSGKKTYEDFLSKRRKLIAEGINKYMDSLTIFKPSKEETVKDLISKGENVRVEFKETLLYDTYQKQPNKELKEQVAKEVVAFGNTQGGTLIIGVVDSNKRIVGLERDLNIIKKGKDGFELQLNQVLRDKIGEHFVAKYIRTNFEEVDEKTICIVNVEESPDPLYFGNEKEFYVRTGSSTKSLNIEEATRYIRDNWK